ncbi:hypothetical protein FDH97_gp180 [Erwinia phage vB_EamM_Deimos-Minion]|uniref:Uncharacterized protein n=1 Tax=Erwinia phage vB_EamM_Deimos-Minion TaxID=1815986 RepID=A0A173GFP2_9CAUD|nr:hypothetical protein FDH97_gp180 [Erwinia phage vB_EamM_Deimos-Minion]ANH52278.2 hypothetical protein DM_180 [Erwinia phage vB_EamM_Deimos-Minion]
MKIEYTIDPIVSPINEQRILANRFTIDTPDLSITGFISSLDVLIKPIGPDARPHDTYDRHLAYEISVVMKDLEKRYPARPDGSFRLNVSVGDFPEKEADGYTRRWLPIIGLEAESEIDAMRLVIRALFGELLRPHDYSHTVVNKKYLHVCEQLMDLGLVNIPNGDYKSPLVMTRVHDGEVSVDRAWRVVNNKLALKRTILTRQIDANTRQTRMFTPAEHQFFELDGSLPFNPTQNRGHGFFQPCHNSGLSQDSWMRQQAAMQMNAMGSVAQYGLNAMNYQQPSMQHGVPAYHNRSLVESDLGPRNEDTPIRGKVKYIEVAPVLITEDSASIVNDGSHNAYGVYRREELGGGNLAVHIGDFLDGGLAVAYATKMGKFFNVDVEDYVSPAPAEYNK